jgi:hypothetical protein
MSNSKTKQTTTGSASSVMGGCRKDAEYMESQRAAVLSRDLFKVTDHRGNLTAIEGGKDVPFDIKRVFFIYDAPCAAQRGAHAHWSLQQFVVCLSGGLDVYLDDGASKWTVHLNRPWQGLYIPPLVWASEGNFDTGTVYLVLASDHYNAADYIRDYDAFTRAVRGKQAA